MNEVMPYLILIISLFLLKIYSVTKNYDSLKGIILLILGLVSLYLKFFFISNKSGFFLSSTFWLSGLVMTGFTLLGVIVILFFRKYPSPKLKYFVSLFSLYLLFGFFQQLFFQYVFLETVYYLTNKIMLSSSISALFYAAFHKKNLYFFIITFIAGFVWSSAYLYFGNLIWIAFSHGVLGTFAYTSFVKTNMIKTKLYFLK